MRENWSKMMSKLPYTGDVGKVWIEPDPDTFIADQHAEHVPCSCDKPVFDILGRQSLATGSYRELNLGVGLGLAVGPLEDIDLVGPGG